MEADGEWSDGSDDALKSGSATGVSDGEDESKNEEKKTIPSSKLLKTDPVNAILDKIDAELGAMKSFSNSSQAKSSKSEGKMQSIQRAPTTSSTVNVSTTTANLIKPQQQNTEALQKGKSDVTNEKEPVKDGETYHSDLDSVAAEQIDEKFKEIMKKKRGGYLQDLKVPKSNEEKNKNDDLKSNMNHSKAGKPGCQKKVKSSTKLVTFSQPVISGKKPPTGRQKVESSLVPIPSPELPHASHNQFKFSGYASDLESIKTEDFENKFSELLVKDGSCDSVYQGQTTLSGLRPYEQTKLLSKEETSPKPTHITLNHTENKIPPSPFNSNEDTIPKTILVKKEPTPPRSMLSIYGRPSDQQTQGTSTPTCPPSSMFRNIPQSSGHNTRPLRRSFSLDEKCWWSKNRECFSNSLASSSKSTTDESEELDYSSSLRSISSLDSVFSCRESNLWDVKALMSREHSTNSVSSGYAAEVDLSSNDSGSLSISSTDLPSDGMDGHFVKSQRNDIQLDEVLDRVLSWDISSVPVGKSKPCFSTASESDAKSSTSHSRDLIVPEEITEGIPFAKKNFIKQRPSGLNSNSDSFQGLSIESSTTSDTSCLSESQCNSSYRSRREPVVSSSFSVGSPIATPDQNFSMANYCMVNPMMNHPMGGGSAERMLMNLGFGGSTPLLPERFLKSWYEKMAKAQFEQQRLLLAQMETLSQQQAHLMSQGRHHQQGQSEHQQHGQVDHQQLQQHLGEEQHQQNHQAQSSAQQQTFSHIAPSHKDQYQYDIPKQNQQAQHHPMGQFYGQHQNFCGSSLLHQQAHPYPQHFHSNLSQMPGNFHPQQPPISQQASTLYENQPQARFQPNQKAEPFKNSEPNNKNNSEACFDAAIIHHQSRKAIRNTRLAKLRDYLESHAGLLNINKVGTHESRRQQFANRRQNSLPVSLDTLAEVEEPASNRPNALVEGKQVKKFMDMKPFICPKMCQDVESAQSSNCLTGSDIEDCFLTEVRDASDNIEIDEHKKIKSKENADSDIQKKAEVKHFSNDSMEVAEIMDKIKTVEPAMVSIVLQDVDGNVKKSAQEAVNCDNSHLHVPLSASNSLSPIPQSPVTVIEATALDNQLDSLDMDDGMPRNLEGLPTQDVSVSVDDGSQSPLVWNDSPEQENENEVGIQVDDGRLSPLEMFYDYEKLLQVVRDLGGMFYLSSDASVQYDLSSESEMNFSPPQSPGSLTCSRKNLLPQKTVFSDSDSSASDSSSAFLTLSSTELLSPPVRRRNSKSWDLKKSKSLSKRWDSLKKSLTIPSSPIFVITNEDGVENSIDPDSPEVESPLLFRPIKNEYLSSSSTTGSFKVKNPSARRLSRSGKLTSRKLSDHSSDVPQSTSFETDLSYSDNDCQSEESSVVVSPMKNTVFRCDSIEQECQTEISWEPSTGISSPYTKIPAIESKCSTCHRYFQEGSQYDEFGSPNNCLAEDLIFENSAKENHGISQTGNPGQYLAFCSNTEEGKLPTNIYSKKEGVEDFMIKCSETCETDHLSTNCSIHDRPIQATTISTNTDESKQLLTNCSQTDEPKQHLTNCSQTDEPKRLITNCSQTDEPKQLITNCSQTDEPKQLITNCSQTDEPKQNVTSCSQTNNDLKQLMTNSSQTHDASSIKTSCSQTDIPNTVLTTSTQTDNTRQASSICVQTDNAALLNTCYSDIGDQNRIDNISQTQELNKLVNSFSQTDSMNKFHKDMLCQTHNINNAMNNHSQTCASYFVHSNSSQTDENKINTINQSIQTDGRTVLTKVVQTSCVVRTCEAFSQTAMKDKVNRRTNTHVALLNDNFVNGDSIVDQNNYGKNIQRRFTSNATFSIKGKPLKGKTSLENQQNNIESNSTFDFIDVAPVIRTCRESDPLRKSVKDLASLFDRS